MASTIAALVAGAENPAAAEAGFERFWARAEGPVRAALEGERALLPGLVAVFAASEFLTEALVQEPELVLWLQRARRTAAGRAREDWAAELASHTAALPAPLDPNERARSLVGFRRRELLRIAWRDLSGEANLAETTQDLSHLADAVLQQAYVWAWNDGAGRYGLPRGPDGGGAELAVLGLGKLGGAELNYSSDIDLMFLASADGETSGGASATSNREFFARVAQQVIHTVSAATADGFAYRVDMRLRPGGREGELVLPLSQARDYYRDELGRGARAWELQMLIRARPCAGSQRLARAFLEEVAPAVYPAAADARVLADGVLSIREQISSGLRRERALRRRGEGVDVKLDPGGIRDLEFVTQYLQRRHGGRDRWLRTGNTLIALQRLHDKRHLPAGEFQRLSAAYELLRRVEHRAQLRRNQQTHTLPGDSPPALRAEVERQMQAVRSLYEAYLRPAAEAAARPAAPPADREGRQMRRLLHSAATRQSGEQGLRALSPRARRRLAWALERSDLMAEMLTRRPDLAEVLEATAAPAAPTEAAAGALRRFHQRATLWLLVEEGEAARPIEEVLARHTALAEAIVGLATEPPLAVLALGRMGLGELDVLSDLDLVFVAPEGEREGATRRATELIQRLTAYTQDGSLYNVDTRLRPGGREGELVQTASSLGRYFRERADWWEAISYLKARWVAGDRGVGEAALEAVREAIGGREFVEPAGLRDRMEREGKPGRWGLKTAPGGYYDADFLLSRRWLGRADLRRRAMPGLARAARELGEGELAELVAFLRAADHALRVGTGRAGSRVPAAGEALDRAWAWLGEAEGAAKIGAAQRRIREIYAQSH